MKRLKSKIQKLNKLNPVSLDRIIIRLEDTDRVIISKVDIRRLKKIKKELDKYKKVVIHLESRVERLLLRTP